MEAKQESISMKLAIIWDASGNLLASLMRGFDERNRRTVWYECKARTSR